MSKSQALHITVTENKSWMGKELLDASCHTHIGYSNLIATSNSENLLMGENQVICSITKQYRTYLDELQIAETVISMFCKKPRHFETSSVKMSSMGFLRNIGQHGTMGAGGFSQ